MSHVLKKISIAGAKKGGDKPKPPIFKPPVMGELQYGASFSYSETLDLVSDGPIEGLCNRFGKIMDGEGILQGIYLDDTPVAVSSSEDPRDTAVSAVQEETANISPSELESGSGTGVKSCRRFFQALNQQKRRSRDGFMTLLKKDGTRGPYINGEYKYQPNVSMWMIRWRRNNRCRSFNPKTRTDYSTYIRAYIKYYGGTDQRFYWYLNANRRTDTGNSQDDAVYRNSHKAKGMLQKLFWTDQTSVGSSKFFFGFGHRSGGGFFDKQLFKKSSDNSEAMVRSEIQEIMDLWNNNNGNLEPDANPIQKALAAKALTSLNWNGSQMNPGTGAAGNGLLHNWLEKSNSRKCHVIIKVEETNSNLIGKTVVEDGQLANMKTYLYGQNNGWGLERVINNASIRIADVTCPEVDASGIMTGKMHGFIVLQFAPIWRRTSQRCSGGEFARSYTVAIKKITKDAIKDIQSLRYTKEIVENTPTNEFEISSLKFNYSNVLAEVRKGKEDQIPFKYFKQVFIDHVYAAQLFGPFSSKAKIYPQRINANTDMLRRSSVLGLEADNYNLDLGNDKLPINEGSDDERVDAGGTTRDYSAWANNSLVRWDEQAIPVTHTIYNPNVTEAFITLNISNLRDTLVTEVDNVGGNSSNDFKVGTTFPTVLNIQVEVGTFGENVDGSRGSKIPFGKPYNYRIVALVEGDTLVDIGNPDYKKVPSDKEFIVRLDSRQNKLNEAFKLPPVNISHNEILSADGEAGIEAGTIEQDSVQERYIQVTKLSFETNSVLLSKAVALQKVTEIIPVDLPYPFSAIIGTKLDSRAFGAIPKRSFDCKLKKVKVPNNYFPTVDGQDKRYWHNVGAYNQVKSNNPESLLVYEGDWDGDFNTELQWTDNPAWILYDLLTNQRYGMGSHIDVNSINKWQLYKIGRFCDSVDQDGYFEGVTDGRGGREPRFSCNVVFDKGQKIYDAINTIAGLFRGRVFFGNSEINFVDDRPRGPVNLFTNESVKDGLFFYSNNRRDEQYNTIEVGFKDRFDNFAPKIEIIEDEEDIKQRGVFKKKIEGIGITSRAMARRAGQHQIFSSIDENQTVAFTAGLESLLCQPGDLVVVEDELKTNKANFGKILAVDIPNETIRLSNSFVADDMGGSLTIYNPTGRDTIEGIDDIADINRSRYLSFTVTGADTDSWAGYTGDYMFSGYTAGYSDASGADGETRYQEYGLYTGLTTGLGFAERQTEIYFETGVTGWVFASGTGAGNLGAFDLASGDFISELTGDQGLFAVGTGKITVLDMNTANKRSSVGADLVAFSGFDDDSFIGPYDGVMNNEISGASPNQITVLSVTGEVINKTYGSLVSGINKPELLPFVKLGSPAKFELTDTSPFIYKVISMKEQNPNEYLVTATKYDTGKFNLIEKNISIEDKKDTYSYQVAQEINGITYATLDAPVIDVLTTGVPDVVSETFNVTGMWSGVDNSTGYNVILTYPNGETEEHTNDETLTGHSFTGLAQVGVFNFSVNALGNKGGVANVNAYFDSDYASSGLFIVYDELFTFSRSFLDRITLVDPTTAQGGIFGID